MSTGFAVDLRVCQNIGQCSFTAPELFPLNDDGTLAFRNDGRADYESPALGAEDAELAQAAVALCPMQAIRLEERN